MRRSILGCLLLVISAGSAAAQSAPARRFDTPVWGGGRTFESAVGSPTKDHPPRDDRDEWRRNHDWNRRGRGRHRGSGYPPSWGWVFPPVFVTPTYWNTGYSLTVPYAPAYVDPYVVDPYTTLPNAAGPNVTAPALSPVVPAAPPAPAPAAANAAPANARFSGPEQKARAGRYLGYGDAQFSQQKYPGALGRYKSAANVASDLAEAYLRQGFTYVALGQYESAARVFRRGLALQPNWQGTHFRLASLYDGADAAKTQHLENLAKAVEANPFDSELLLVLGLELYFDGQFDRAELCFRRAVQLGGDLGTVLADFVPNASGDPQPAAGKLSF